MSNLSKALWVLVVIIIGWIIHIQHNTVSKAYHQTALESAYRDGVMDEREGRVIEK